MCKCYYNEYTCGCKIRQSVTECKESPRGNPKDPEKCPKFKESVKPKDYICYMCLEKHLAAMQQTTS
jgi:hypothetical protein